MNRAVIRAFSALSVFVVVLTMTVAATAHPHVLPTVSTAVIFDNDGRLTAIRHAWTYDAAYSTFVMRDLDANKDGIVTKEELTAFAGSQLKALAEHRYFTKVTSDSLHLELGAVDVHAIGKLNDGRLQLDFTIPLSPPNRVESAPPKLLVIEIFDPNFFAYFTMATDGVHLVGARASCVSDVVGPQPINLKQTRSVPAAFWQALDGSASAQLQFINRITVRCP